MDPNAGGEDGILPDRLPSSGLWSLDVCRRPFLGSCHRRAFLTPDQPIDLHLVIRRGVVDEDMHDEAVHLGLRERVGSLLFHRVLGRHHHKKGRQLVGLPCHRDLAFLHGLQEGSLDFGRGPVDFVCQDQVREDGPLVEPELPLPVSTVVYLCSGYIRRQEVRRKLNAAEVRVKVAGQGLHGPSLGQAGQPFHQEIPVGEKRQEDALHHGLLANDGFGHACFQVEDLAQCSHDLPILERSRERPGRLILWPKTLCDNFVHLDVQYPRERKGNISAEPEPDEVAHEPPLPLPHFGVDHRPGLQLLHEITEPEIDGHGLGREDGSVTGEAPEKDIRGDRDLQIVRLGLNGGRNCDEKEGYGKKGQKPIGVGHRRSEKFVISAAGGFG